MTPAIREAVQKLEVLLEANELTRGMVVRAQGSHLIAGRVDPPGPYAAEEPDDRIRFTRLGSSGFGLSVRRHTGRWEKTPYSGSLEELVQTVCATMQHLVAEP